MIWPDFISDHVGSMVIPCIQARPKSKLNYARNEMKPLSN